MTDLNKLRSEFEAVTDIYHCIYNADLDYYFSGSKFASDKAEIEVNAGWKAWKKAKAQAVPDGWAIVPQELPLDMALKIAKERILEQPPVKDPVLNEILDKAHKENIQSEQCRLMRDYKEMVKRLSESGAEG